MFAWGHAGRQRTQAGRGRRREPGRERLSSQRIQERGGPSVRAELLPAEPVNQKEAGAGGRLDRQRIRKTGHAEAAEQRGNQLAEGPGPVPWNRRRRSRRKYHCVHLAAPPGD